MAAYVIFNVDIRDPEAYKEYMTKAPAFVKKHGGEYLARGGAITVEEGNWRPKRIAMLKFPSIAAVRAVFDDPDYAPLKQLRQRLAKSEVVIVEGL